MLHLICCFCSRIMSDEDEAGAASESDPFRLQQQLKTFINEHVVGGMMPFKGPFGTRRLIQTSCHTALSFIEEFLINHVSVFCPLATSTLSNVTGLQSALYLDESRSIFQQALHCSGQDELFFLQTDLNGLMVNLMQMLHLFAPIVFVGAHDTSQGHLHWITNGAEIVVIPLNADGRLDLLYLRKKLEEHRHSDRPLVGCFSAVTDITAHLQNDLLVTALLHHYGALAVWNYYAAAPHTIINVNPEVPDDVEGAYHKDALLFSMENFVGGLQTCGVLVVKKKLLKPDHMDMTNVTVMSAVRAGLVMQLKQTVGADFILHQHQRINLSINRKLQSCKNVLSLSNEKLPRLATLSFVIRHSTTGLFLHHKFVCALLNDLFGIQARAQSAPDTRYGRLLFNLTSSEQSDNTKICQPGFVTIEFPWYACDEEVDYILEAIQIIGDHGGWYLLPQYLINFESGEWHHQSDYAFSDRFRLNQISYQNGSFSFEKESIQPTSQFLSLEHILLRGRNIIMEAKKDVPQLNSTQTVNLPFKWFLLPSEAKSLMSNTKRSQNQEMPLALRILSYPDTDPVLETNPIGSLDSFTFLFPHSTRTNRAENPPRSSSKPTTDQNFIHHLSASSTSNGSSLDSESAVWTVSGKLEPEVVTSSNLEQKSGQDGVKSALMSIESSSESDCRKNEDRSVASSAYASTESVCCQKSSSLIGIPEEDSDHGTSSPSSIRINPSTKSTPSGSGFFLNSLLGKLRLTESPEGTDSLTAVEKEEGPKAPSPDSDPSENRDKTATAKQPTSYIFGWKGSAS